uniref:Uncharacterized protein n=1 Tax=Arundo donax TaxID=35708 RepID=A0A0A9BR62_ARUDO
MIPPKLFSEPTYHEDP